MPLPAATFLAAALALALPATAQTTFDPFPNQSASRYHFDFTRLFASPEAEKSDRAAFEKALNELCTLQGHVADDGGHLLHALQLSEDAQTRFHRHYIYLDLRHAVDTTDAASHADAAALDDAYNAKTAFLRSELMHVTDATFARFAAEVPELEQYRYALAAIRRYTPHTLPVAEEKMLASMASLSSGWQADLYDTLVPRRPVAANASREARQEAFRMRYAGVQPQRDLYAFTLLHLVKAGNVLAQARHYDDAATESYFDRHWTRAQVKEMLDRVAQAAGVYQRYQRLRAEHVKRAMGYSDVNLWDLSARPAGAEPPRFTIDEARQVILEATAPLGPEYHRELAALLDPANGRMDIVPGQHRRPGGFSQGFVGVDSVFFSAGFGGTYNDVRVLAHESTHAVQRQLMNRNRVRPVYFGNPISEALAIFNELLLADHLYQREKDPVRRQFFLEQFFDGKGMEAFDVAPEAELEEAVYDGVAAGTIKGAGDLDALTRRIYARYSIWPARHDELKSQWMLVTLMYEDPFYDVNYVYGALIGLRLYAMYVHDAQSFASRYVAMMSNGNTAPPAELLEKYFAIDLRDPRLLSDAVALLEKRVDDLQGEYGPAAH